MEIVAKKSLHFTRFIVVGIALSIAGVQPAAANDTKTYNNITQNMFDKCIKNHKGGGGWAVYKGGNIGTLKLYGDTAGHVADGEYNFEPPSLTYRLTDFYGAGHLASWEKYWAGFDGTMARCAKFR
jgi:hypothetical protein